MKLSPENHRPPPAAIKTAQVASSRERGTSPSSRACSMRRGDAGSVFSRSLSPAIADSCYDASKRQHDALRANQVRLLTERKGNHRVNRGGNCPQFWLND